MTPNGFPPSNCAGGAPEQRASDLQLEELRGHVLDFLCAVDNGNYGDALMIGSEESAFVRALRDAVEPSEANCQGILDGCELPLQPVTRRCVELNPEAWR
jgi:hypothetical protein